MTQFGRERELERVEQAIARACGGAGSLFLLTGEGGIGKSSLARAAAQRAQGHQRIWSAMIGSR